VTTAGTMEKETRTLGVVMTMTITERLCTDTSS
jgi:hypothetical protein